MSNLIKGWSDLHIYQALDWWNNATILKLFLFLLIESGNKKLVGFEKQEGRDN